MWHYRWLRRVLWRLGTIAAFQWNAADYLGQDHGYTGIALAWYPRARARQPWDLGVGKRDLWEETIEKPGTALEIAGSVLRHVMLGEPLDVPVMLAHKLVHHGHPTGFRILVNHPRVLRKDIDSMLVQVLREVRRGKGRGFTERDTEFLDALRNAGLEPGRRAPRGFWPGFVPDWNDGHPDAQMTANYARVRYHRLNVGLGV